MLAVSVWFWIRFIVFVLAMLALDLGVFHRDPHEVRPKEAGIWVAVWVALAMAFAAGLHFLVGKDVALTFLTGYVIEESLSADNIFVMVLIFEYFRVPKAYQHRVLFYGILGALVMRGLFIAAGTALVVTGVRMASRNEDEFEGDDNRVVKLVRRVLPMTQQFHGKHFFTVENGRRLAKPPLLVLILVEFTDLIFAVDSIPAIFGVTTHPFIVFTSNIFAVLGLRSLYFLLAAVVDRFHLLKYGLAVILTFVGVKMLGEKYFTIDIALSLLVIVGVLMAAVAASMIWPKKEESPAPQA